MKPSSSSLDCLSVESKEKENITELVKKHLLDYWIINDWSLQ